MCGIVGHVGPLPPSERSLTVLMDGLGRLEYRGYDSAGVALAGPSGLDVVKAAGTRYEMSIQKMVRLIQGAGREAAQRDTEYRVLKTFSERSE